MALTAAAVLLGIQDEIAIYIHREFFVRTGCSAFEISIAAGGDAEGVGVDAGVVHGGALAVRLGPLVTAVHTGAACGSIYGDLSAYLSLFIFATAALGIFSAVGVEGAGVDADVSSA